MRPSEGSGRARWRLHPRIRAVLRQLAWALLTLFVTSVVVFMATSQRDPEDLARASIGRQATDGQIKAFTQRHDLDAPVQERYTSWLTKAVGGDFGESVVTGRSVRSEIQPRAERTLILALASLVLLVPIGIALGVFTARRIGTGVDRASNIVAVVVSACPEFVVGLVLIAIFAVSLGWLPVDSGSGIVFGSGVEVVEAYTLPTLTLVVVSVPYIMRVTRVALREEFVAPYTRAATLRGYSPRRVIWGHAFRNAASPILNATAINLVYLLGGVVVVENVFGLPGLGEALVGAVGAGDTTTVQAIALLMAAMFIAISVVTDALAVMLNPRLKVGAQ